MELSFCFSDCISACTGNALVVLDGYSTMFPSLICFSSGFEQTQKLAVKSRESLAPQHVVPIKSGFNANKFVRVTSTLTIHSALDVFVLSWREMTRAVPSIQSMS